MDKLLWVALVASAMLLSGCLRSTTTVVVDETGGGTGAVLLAVDPARASELAGEAGGLAAAQLSLVDDAQICDQFRQLTQPSNLPSTASESDYDEDGFCGRLIEFTFVDVDELRQSLDLATGGQAGSLDTLTLGVEGDEWVFEAPLGGLSSALQSATSSLPTELVDTAIENSSVIYELTLPGSPVEGANNADEVDGDTFRWVIDAGAPPEALTARSTAGGDVGGGGGGGGGSKLLGVILAAIGGIAVLALAGYLLISRRRGGGAPEEPRGGSDPAAFTPPPAPPV